MLTVVKKRKLRSYGHFTRASGLAKTILQGNVQLRRQKKMETKIEVWNLNNLDTDVLHANEIFKGSVKRLAVSSTAGIVACHGEVQGQAEVKLVEVSTGRVVGTLQQEQHVDHVSSVTLSTGGRYLLTHNVWMPKEEDELRELTIDWSLLSCVVLWDTEKQQPLLSTVNSRFAFFDCQGSSLGIVVCDFYSASDFTESSYTFSFWHLDSELGGTQEVTFPLPDHTDFVTEPILFYDRRSYTWALICVLQQCHYQTLMHRTYETFIYIKYLSKNKTASSVQKPSKTTNKTFSSSRKEDFTADLTTKIVRLKDLINCPGEKPQIACVKLTQTNLLLIIYVKNVEQFSFDRAQGLVVPTGVEKGAVLYDLMKEVVIMHKFVVFKPSSDVRCLQLSGNSDFCIDQKLQVFEMAYAKMLHRVQADWCPSSVRFALDGLYLVGLTSDCRSIQVCRTNDGTIKGSLLVHGKATHLDVGEDGRTIAVGTTDGRVMLLSLVLDLSDPYIELIQHFPSRRPPTPPSLTSESGSELLVDKDTQVIQGNSPELQRLSAKIRFDRKMAVGKQPGFRRLTNAILMTQQARSQACCIQ